MTAPTLAVVEAIPDGLVDAAATDLHRLLAGPTLVHLPGRRPEPLFVSILLHGNEDVGLAAIQNVLRRYDGKTLPRALSLFVGNVAAARQGLRRLGTEPDYNRIWPGTAAPWTAEAALARDVVDRMRGRGVFASIDLHNNTGLNPHYGCVTDAGVQHLQLAALFGRTAVYFQQPLGTQTAAFAPICPAIACECGRVGDQSGADRAADFVDACLHLSAVPVHPVSPGDCHLYHTVATVKVPAGIDFSLDGRDAPLRFVGELDHANFRRLDRGALLALVRAGSAIRLDVRGEDGSVQDERFLEYADGQIRLTQPVVPAMLTRDEEAVRQDCLCYFMQEYSLTRTA